MPKLAKVVRTIITVIGGIILVFGLAKLLANVLSLFIPGAISLIASIVIALVIVLWGVDRFEKWLDRPR